MQLRKELRNRIELIRIKFKGIRAHEKRADKRCEDRYYDGIVCTSSNESPTSMDGMIGSPEEGLDMRYSNKKGIVTGTTKVYGNSDPSPFRYNGVVPQHLVDKQRYSDSRLQSKITNGIENGFEGWMSPSPYDLGNKSVKTMDSMKKIRTIGNSHTKEEEDAMILEDTDTDSISTYDNDLKDSHWPHDESLFILNKVAPTLHLIPLY